jgi:3-hydroxymyristoyl/3-hydroxydecanoyl-(acyl carrier protein) dehydratase
VIVAPEIRATERTANGVLLELKIPADLSYFDGHFPGCPLLPGVVQIKWAIDLGRKHIPVAGSFRSLRAVKFTRVILPDIIVTLQLDYVGDKHQLDFVYADDDQLFSSGTALFDVP